MPRTSLAVEVRDSSQVGDARRSAQRLAQAAGLDAAAVSNIAIIVTEMATNLINHGSGGHVLLRGEEGALEICAVDKGRGMDVAASLRDGQSTRGTAGNGLGAIRRLARAFDAYSDARGTVVWVRVGAAAPVELGAVCLPLAGEMASGDDWTASLSAEGGYLFVVDGLGHGPLAATAAQAATHGATDEPPAQALAAAHRRLAGTRGAAAAYVRVNRAAATLTGASVGNIAVAVIAAGRSRSLPAQNGTLAMALPAPVRETVLPLESRALIVIHSDGLGTRWSLEDYAGLVTRHAAVIAAVLWRDWQRVRDDATVVVLRC